jgi:hypothetical protein
VARVARFFVPYAGELDHRVAGAPEDSGAGGTSWLWFWALRAARECSRQIGSFAMSKKSKVILNYIKNLAIVNSSFVAILNRLNGMDAKKADKFLSKFHGMTLAEFMMAVGA